ncbi:hypothetical protein BBJ28_00010466 [Nothophytophthora sp. Chile5]|nr:hypothetical protein BBJ28_00010466 [Nothophytophthora sp. Chile5]
MDRTSASATAGSADASTTLYGAAVGDQDVVSDMTLEIEEPKDDEALELLGHHAHPDEGRHTVELLAATSASLSTSTVLTSAENINTTSSARAVPSASTVGGGRANGSSNVSAVYRWYEIEESFSAKRREESSIAKCTLCRQQGKLERKSCVRFSKSVTSNLWRHLKENHPDVYEKHAGEKKSVQMHRLVGVKKRGRKKKVVAATTVTTDAATASLDQDLVVGGKLLAHPDEGDGQSAAATPKSNKKAKRGDHLFQEYPLGTVGTALHQQHQAASRQTTASSSTASAGTGAAGVTGSLIPGNFNPEKVREAMGYLCLYEMLPFELCSSHAFRNLMVECSGGSGGYVDDSNSFALFAKEIAFGYAKKMAAEVKVRTVMQMKMTDFAHLMVSEWRPSNWISENDTMVAASPLPTVHYTPGGDGEMVFLAVFAIGLDLEFNPFRRCLHVSSIRDRRANHENSIATEPSTDKEVKKAMERVVPCKYMPQVLAVEAPCNDYQSLCTDLKLQFLESVPTLLQNIMIATINEVNISGIYCLGSSVSMGTTDAAASVGIRNRRLDKGEYVESSSAAVVAGSSSDDFYGLPEVEIASSILEELPTSLTGHTYRDLMNKVMYLLAHFKQSPRSRKVLRKLAVDECRMSADAYERVFIARLRDMAISVSGIYYVLSLVVDMMPMLKKYFALHKDGISDFSKLVQLSSLSRYEWSRVGYLKTILKPFADATAKMDGEQYVVSSLIVPSVFTLLEKLRDSHPVNVEFNVEASGNGFAKKSAEAEGHLPEDIEALRDLAFANLSVCFGHLFSVPEPDWSTQKRQTFNLLWAATILDPRTRPFIIKGPLPQQDFWDLVKTEACNVAGTKMKDKENGNDLGESAISLDEEESNHLDGDGVGKSGDLWDDLQANLTSCAQEEMLLSSAKSSLEITKSSNLLEVEVSFFQEEGRISLRANPLEWWQNMRMKYPFLARLARYVLSIPCSVKVNDNPVLCDGGLVKRAPCQMNLGDLCDLLAASMNLRTEKNAHFEAASKQMWSTV